MYGTEFSNSPICSEYIKNEKKSLFFNTIQTKISYLFFRPILFH